MSVAERKAAGDAYDALVTRYTGAGSVAALKTELRAYAETAYGAGSWYQRRHDRNIQGLYAERFENTVSALTDYSREGDDYLEGKDISREMIVGSTVVKNIKDKQTVHMYEDFQSADAVISVRLDEAGLEGIDDYGIMMLVAQAQRDMQAWSDDIFGRTDEKGSALDLDIPRNLGEAGEKEYAAAALSTENAAVKRMKELREKEKMSDGEQEEYNGLSVKYATMRDGALGRHIGYAPVFKQGDALDPGKSRESNVASAGIGEMGRILLDFQWNSIIAGKGMGELSQSMYDKRIWDDTGSEFKAPTVRAVTDMAVSMVATVVQTAAKSLNIFTGVGGSALGALLNTAINTADDLLFAGLDFGGGYKSLQEVSLELGKKVAMNAASAAAGALFSGAGQTFTNSGALIQTGNFLKDGGINGLIAVSGTSAFTQLVLKTASAGAQAALTTVANSAINSFEIKDGGLSFNSKSFTGAMGSAGTWTSTMAEAAKTFTGGVLSAESLETGGILSDHAAERFKTLGITKLATIASGEVAKFATYTAYEMIANKSQLGDALKNGAGAYADNGVTFNLANLESLIDLFDGTGKNDWAKDFSNTGLFEMNFSSNGVSGQLGTGGIDAIGLAKSTYDFSTNITRDDWEDFKLFAGQKIAEGKDWLIQMGKDTLEEFGITFTDKQIEMRGPGDATTVVNVQDGKMNLDERKLLEKIQDLGDSKEPTKLWDERFAPPVAGIEAMPEKTPDLFGLQDGSMLPGLFPQDKDGNSIRSGSARLTGEGIGAVTGPFSPNPLNASIYDIKWGEIATGIEFGIGNKTWLDKTGLASFSATAEQSFAGNGATLNLSGSYEKMFGYNNGNKLTVGGTLAYNTKTQQTNAKVVVGLESQITKDLIVGAEFKQTWDNGSTARSLSIYGRNIRGVR